MNKDKKVGVACFTLLGIAIGICLAAMFIVCRQAFSIL
jgi:tetrahydromethanopterin S-methyltransferase subunit G